MNSAIVNISEILSKVQSISSAGFSAGYSFDEINASEFFDEVVENASFPSPIFSGILILEKSDDILHNYRRVTKNHYDNNLLLCALCDRYKTLRLKTMKLKTRLCKDS